VSGNVVDALYNVVSGRRVVATRSGPSAREVALDYVRSLGCDRDEILCFGPDGVAWRGAVYRAFPADETPSVGRSGTAVGTP